MSLVIRILFYFLAQEGTFYREDYFLPSGAQRRVWVSLHWLFLKLTFIFKKSICHNDPFWGPLPLAPTLVLVTSLYKMLGFQSDQTNWKQEVITWKPSSTQWHYYWCRIRVLGPVTCPWVLPSCPLREADGTHWLRNTVCREMYAIGPLSPLLWGAILIDYSNLTLEY